MALHHPMARGCSTSVPKEDNRLQVSYAGAGFVPFFCNRHGRLNISSRTRNSHLKIPKFSESRSMRVKASKVVEILFGDGKDKDGRVHKSSNDDDSDKSSEGDDSDEDDDLMTEEQRREYRRKIREVLAMNLDVKEEEDPIERKRKMEKLLADYPLVVEEDDPDWPEDADGQGFNWSQFFNKVTIKNVRKDDDDDDYDSDKEMVWQDDDYIKPIKDITTREWEEAVFKDFSPLIVLVHNRYKRPKENEKLRDELVKAVQIFWDCKLPSPRCVAVDAVVEHDLVSALQAPIFPEIIFTKAGKILYRDKEIRTADELSRIMAFFYYGGAKPPCLDKYNGDNLKPIPSLA